MCCKAIEPDEPICGHQLSEVCGAVHRDPAEDVTAFKQGGGQVLIGTPGRLSDFMKRCAAVDTRRLEVSFHVLTAGLEDDTHMRVKSAEAGGHRNMIRRVWEPSACCCWQATPVVAAQARQHGTLCSCELATFAITCGNAPPQVAELHSCWTRRTGCLGL
jgi:hypothetical protein